MKHILQGTAIGLFIATSVFSAVYFFGDTNDNKTDIEDMTIEEAIQLLKGEEYAVLPDQELDQLQKEIKQLELIVEEQTQEIENHKNKDDNDTEVDEEDQEEVVEENESAVEFVLNIETGMHSRNIGEQLKKYGIVEHERDFEKYVIDKDVDRKIQIGQFNLKSDMSLDEIIQVITR